jgi:non-canonical (house-cleaning) NTP pyrophosphatase
MEWWQVIAAMAGAVGLREVVAKYIDRKSTAVSDAKTRTETKASEVDILRDVLAEVKSDSAEKTKKITELTGHVRGLERRMDKLEERERHQLTRAAVHEAWDQIAFQMLLAQNPDHPPPPPITTPALMRAQEEETNGSAE